MCVASEPNTGSPADALMVFVGRGPIQTGNTDFADAINTATAIVATIVSLTLAFMRAPDNGAGRPIVYGMDSRCQRGPAGPGAELPYDGCPTRNEQYQPGLVTVLTLDFVVGS